MIELSIFEAMFFGAVQGLTEFLPVSSSAHLALVGNFFGLSSSEENFAFFVFLHLGTLIAVCIAYKNDICLLFKGFVSLCLRFAENDFRSALTENERLTLSVIIATSPLAFGVFLENTAESFSGSIKAIGILLIVNAVLLFVSDYISKAKNKHRLENFPFVHALFIGVIQLGAVFPGISRSGSTVFGGLVSGLDKKDAVRFSFLISLPAIAGANLIELVSCGGMPFYGDNALPITVGLISSAIFGFLAIKLLRFVAEKGRFSYFSVYCAVLGITAVIYNY